MNSFAQQGLKIIEFGCISVPSFNTIVENNRNYNNKSNNGMTWIKRIEYKLSFDIDDKPPSYYYIRMLPLNAPHRLEKLHASKNTYTNDGRYRKIYGSITGWSIFNNHKGIQSILVKWFYYVKGRMQSDKLLLSPKMLTTFIYFHVLFGGIFSPPVLFWLWKRKHSIRLCSII